MTHRRYTPASPNKTLRLFYCKIRSTTKARPLIKCSVYAAHNKRYNIIYQCKKCCVAFHIGNCFEMYHMMRQFFKNQFIHSVDNLLNFIKETTILKVSLSDNTFKHKYSLNCVNCVKMIQSRMGGGGHSRSKNIQKLMD